MAKIPNDIFFSMVETQIAEGRSVCFRLKGTSMSPLIRDGKDEVILVPCAKEDLNVKDVVLFRYHGRHLLHRIIHRDAEHLILQGDGSITAKEQCTVNDVIGKVKAISRPSGKVISLESWQWRVSSFIWRKIKPLYVFLIAIYSSIKKTSTDRSEMKADSNSKSN